jgi:hypothetical protein
MSSAPGLKIVPQPLTLLQKIDRCAYLVQRYKEGKAERDELDLLKDEFQKHAIDIKHPAALPLRLEGTPAGGPGGTTYFLDLTMREEKREITDKPKAFAALKKALGLAKLIESLTIPFKLLDPNVDEKKRAAFVKKERTGPREISMGLIHPAKPA